MREALVLGEQRGAHLVLADRAVEVTLKRTWRLLGWRQKFSVMSQLMSGLVSGEEIEQEDIDQLRQEGEIEGAIEAFASMLPSVKRHLIDERDVYLAQKIRDAGGQRILAVVGAGHVAGITQALEVEHDLEEFEHVPPVSGWFKVLKASLPLLIVALPFWFFAGSKSEVPIQSLWVWGGSHAILAAVGSALALAHPLAILATALAAPFTSLNPLLAAGWVGGMVQLFMHKPTVADLESLPSAITSFKGFWKHPVTKILLVVALGNLGSSLGTLLSGAWIVTQFLS
jgi:pheromone shutdown-related protein TraB